jgi:hypothetical protein
MKYIIRAVLLGSIVLCATGILAILYTHRSPHTVDHIRCGMHLFLLTSIYIYIYIYIYMLFLFVLPMISSGMYMNFFYIICQNPAECVCGTKESVI